MGWLNSTVEMAWRAAAWRPFQARATEPQRQPGETRFIVAPRQIGGMRVTEETALQVATVFACVTVITKALTSSIWDVFAEDPDGTREMRRQSRLWRLLNVRPNPEMTAFSAREALTMSALLWGNGYAEIERDVAARPAALWPFHPDRARLDRTEDGALVCRVQNQSSGETVLPARDVFHLHGPGIDGLVGYEMARLAARAIGHSMAAETFGAAFFGNGAQMGGVFTSDTEIGDDSKKQLRKAINARHQGPENAHQFLVVDNGLKYQPMSTPPENAQFIETRHLSVEEICRWFGVPPHKIGHLLRATNNNIEHQGLEFVRDAMTPWAERMAQEADFKLLPVGNRVLKTRFDLDWLAEGDAKTRAEADGSLVDHGIINRNEARRKRGMNSIGPDGEQFTVQCAMTTLDKVGQDPAPATPAAEPGPGASDDDDPAAAGTRGAVVPINRSTTA